MRLVFWVRLGWFQSGSLSRGGAFLAAGGGFEGVSWGGSLGDGFGGKVGQKAGN